MKKYTLSIISIAVLILFIVGSAWAESYDINAISVPVISDSASVIQYGNVDYQAVTSWKIQQNLDKFNNINIETVSTYEKQVEKVKRTQDYLKYWGWRE